MAAPARKLLLSSICKPFGVTDELQCARNLPELLHYAVTRMQGAFSMRIHHRSHGLTLIAANLQVPTTVLDFPTEAEFVEELRRGGYTHVGISFIVPNFEKAQRLCRLVREHAPTATIIVGGHGTRIPGVKELLGADELCIGEGVAFMRRYFGEDPEAPIEHPVLPVNYQRRVLGVKIPDRKAVLMPGVGCANKCHFCCTAAFFGGWTPFFRSADELFATMCRISDQMQTTEFWVQDENFLGNEPWIRRLLELMETTGRRFALDVFTTLADINRYAPTDLVKLGVRFAWIGIESKRELFPKVVGIDARAVLQRLKAHGISVLASAILFLDHHDRQTLDEDVDYVIGLEPDFIQFMELSPQPGTALYDNYAKAGRIATDMPYRFWHGQDAIWFDHPHFPRETTKAIIDEAFRRDYETLGPGLMRAADTLIAAVATSRNWSADDASLQARARELEKAAREMRGLLPVFRVQAVNERVRRKAIAIEREYERLLGPLSVADRLVAAGLALGARLEGRRIRLHTNNYQPPTFLDRYRQ